MKKALELLKKIRNNNITFSIQHELDNAIKELEKEISNTCDTCKYLAKDKGWYCENFGFSCSSAGFEEHMPDDGYCCNRYENDN